MKQKLLFILLCIFLSDVALAKVILGTVIAVHDGDTFTLQNESGQKKIRLAGIDAPELNQSFGAESRKALGEAILDKQVQVEATKSDKYGRLIGRVILDGVDINLQQVQSGMAWVYSKYLKELSNGERLMYLEAESKSRGDAVGLWKDAGPVAPWTWRK